MNANHLISLFKRAGDGVRRRPWLHFLSVCTLFSTFLCFVLTLAAALNLDRAANRWVGGAELTVYVKEGIPSADVDRLITALTRTPEVGRVDRISEERARQLFADEMGEFGDMVRSLPASSFPVSVEVYLTSSAAKDALLRKQLADRIAALSMVDKVDAYDDWFSKISSVVTIGHAVSWGLGLSALIVAILVVSAVVRIGVSARAREIEVLGLVGATRRYIRFPFLLEGAVESALAMGLAVLCLEAVLSKAQSAMGDILPLIGIERFTGLSTEATLLLIAGSAVAGVLGSRLSLKGAMQQG